MAGRPTDYREEYCEQVEKLCKILNVNTAGIAFFFSTTEDVIEKWISFYPEFKKSVEKGRIAHVRYILLRKLEKEKRNRRRKKQASENAQLRLRSNMSAQMSYHLKNKNKRHVFDLLGYSCEDLMRHLESQFDRGMTWENYGKYWHVDHKIPASWFSYTDSDSEEFKRCWALSNLQPLEGHINIKKNNRYASA